MVVLHIYPIDSYLATDFVSYHLILLISSWKISYRSNLINILIQQGKTAILIQGLNVSIYLSYFAVETVT